MSSPFLSTRAPLLWLLAPLIAGLAAARHLALPAWGIGPMLAIGMGAGLVAGWAARSGHRRSWMVAICLAAGCSGFALLHLRHPPPGEHEHRPPREVTVTLRVDTRYGTGAGARSLAGLGRISAAGELERALVGELVYFSAIRRASIVPRVGAEIEIRGVIEPLPREPAGFDDYLANLGIQHRLVRARIVREIAAPGRGARTLAAGRERLSRILGLGLEDHPDIAALYRAMLLGEKAALRPEQEDAFVRSGTFHVFSVSGLHVGVIAGALRLLAGALRVRARVAAGLTLGLLWLYVQITGAGAPSVRAFVMIAFMLASECFRLPGNAFSALVASALFLLLLEPLQLFSSGFQMSYTVVAALILMGAPLARRALERWHPYALLPRPDWRWRHTAVNWLGRGVINSVAGCWVAFLASVPAGIGFFGVVSPGSLPANLIILPLSSLALVAGFVSLLAGLVGLHPWSALFNAAAALLILAAEALLTRTTGLPGVWFAAHFRADWLPAASMAAFVAVLVAGASAHWSPHRGGFWPPVAFVLLLLIFGVKFSVG